MGVGSVSPQKHTDGRNPAQLPKQLDQQPWLGYHSLPGVGLVNMCAFESYTQLIISGGTRKPFENGKDLLVD